MSSEARGKIVVPVWVDSGVVKPLADDNGDIPVSQDTPDNLRAGIYGRISGAWQRQPLQFGYGSGYAQALGTGSAGAGVYSASSTAVPANTVRVIDAASLINASGARGAAYLYLVATSGAIYLAYSGALPVNTPLLLPDPLVLSPTEYIRFDLYGIVAGDVIIGGAHGYDFSLNL